MAYENTDQTRPLRDREHGTVATAARHSLRMLHSALGQLRSTQEGSLGTGARPLARCAMRRWSLSDGETLRLTPRGTPLAIRCTRGTSLVTQEGDPTDHVLEAGGELVTRPRGLVVVWALSALELRAAA